MPSTLVRNAALKVLIKMATVVATIKIMPTSPEVELGALESEAIKKIKGFAGEGETKTEIEPIAFGLKAVKITFVMDESLGSPDAVSEQIAELEGVNSAEVIDVRRALG